MQYNHTRAGTSMGNAPALLKCGNTCVRERGPKKKKKKKEKKILRIYCSENLRAVVHALFRL